MGQKLGRFKRKQYLRKRPTPTDHNFFHKLFEKSSWTNILTFPKKHLVAQQLLGATSRLIPIQARVQTPDHRRVEFGQYLS